MSKPPDMEQALNSFIRTNSESPNLEAAELIISSGQSWRLSDELDTENRASAYVLDSCPEPFLVEWDLPAGGKCECGNYSAESPCIHFLSLILQLAGKRTSDRRFDPLRKVESPPVPASDPFMPDLFDWDIEKQLKPPAEKDRRIYVPSPTLPKRLTTEDVLSPDADLLFFTEPNPVEKKPVVVMGLASRVTEHMKRRSVLPAKPADLSPEARFKDLRGGIWAIRPALSPVRDDGTLGPPRPWTDEGLPDPQFPGSEEIRSTLAEYIGAGDTFLSPRGRVWRYVEAQSLRFRFEALLSANNDDPLYEPVAELICPGDTGENRGSEGEVSISGAVFISGNGLLILDSEKTQAAHLEDLGDSLWFVRLMLSRRVLSASDLKARLTGRRKPPANILIELPELPDSLEVLEPKLVLEMTSRDGGTDLIPGWHYRGVIIDGRGIGDVVMDSSLSRPKPVGLRNRTAEDAVLDAAEDILGPALAWRRGRYARLSGDSNVPLRVDAALQDVLSEFGEKLLEAGVLLRLENRPIRRGGSLNIRTSRKGSVLEMNTAVKPGDSGDENLDEELDIELDSWLEQGGLVRTGSGYFTLTGKALDQLNFLRDHGMGDGGFLSTSPDNLSLIDAVYTEIRADEETSGDLERRREAYRRLTSEVSDQRTQFPSPPESFTATLRPYQTQGYRWLMRLREEGLGGCLADDMGLGKTVQTLAYLSRLVTDEKLGPTLLVGPVVTLGNWEAEIRRFAPSISFHRYAGPVGKRYLPTDDSGVNLIIVSYQTLRNDIEKFLDRDWDHIILDEAHYVKNAASRTFKAIRSLRAGHRIALTGTPIENHLDDLWSQMSFLNPGLLGSRNHFNDRFVQPVEEGEATGEKSAVSRLSEIIAPFILRRRKSEVLTELPPKDEAIIRCEMTDQQSAAYESMRGLYRRQVTGLLSSEGLNRARVEIFTIISKLRLLAIHPPLAGEPFAGIEGGKMAAVDRLLEDIMDEDHKTLVFSQFLGALDRAESTCRRNDWVYSRLTGSTKDREEPIRRFNEDADRRIFLLSLKAGGVGINLTAADYVMLLDPWWNPAVEAQAVDRAHRMGQKRPVMVYRFITSDTIEERVLDLQERKKGLIAGVLGDDAAVSLNETEIMDLFE